MQIRNTAKRYGLMAIVLHWLLAVVVIGLIIVGLCMVRMDIGLTKLKYYGWHKEFGLLVLFLVTLRLAWRWSGVIPSLPAHLGVLQKFAAHSAHWALYILMFAMPLTGWMKSSAAGLPVSFFGLFVMPDIVSENAQLRVLLTVMHEWMGYALIAIIIAHATAAIQHHFYYKDDILRRMLP